MSNKKDNTIPRYTKNIYLSHIKHLTRTLNTFIAYESVKRIFIKFSKSKNKYQLFLDINNEVNEIDYSGTLILIYDKSISDIQLYNESEIIKVLDSPISKEKQQIDVLDNLSNLIKKYTDTEHKSVINNFFFKEDLEQILNEINLILPDNVITQYKPKNKNTYVKTMVEKKIYYLIKNQITFRDINKINSLENSKIGKKQNIINIVKEEIEILNKNIQYLKNSKLPYIFPSDMETIATKQEIQNAIQYYYDDSVEKYNLSSYTLEELEEQLFLIDSKKEQGIYEPKSKSFIDRVNFDISLKVERYFTDFIEFVEYCIANNKDFTSNTISRYITNIHNQLKLAKKSTGLKRRRKIQDLKEKYPKIIDMNSDDKFYYITKLNELYNNAHFYSNISDSLDNTLMYLSMYMPTDDVIEELKSAVSKETLAEIGHQEAQNRLEQIELDSKLAELDISEEDYEFNNFYEILLKNIEETMGYYAPITIEEFDEYYEFLENPILDDTDIISMSELAELEEEKQGYSDMLNYINQFIKSDIYEKIELNQEDNNENYTKNNLTQNEITYEDIPF